MYSGGGDSLYVSEAREIGANVQRLLNLSNALSRSVKGSTSDVTLSSKLREAKAIAMATHAQLQHFFSAIQEGTTDPVERSQRKQTHRKLDNRFQNALRALDRVAQQALRSGDSKCTTASGTTADLPSSRRHLSDDDELMSFASSEEEHHSRYWQPRRKQHKKRGDYFSIAATSESNLPQPTSYQALVYPNNNTNNAAAREVSLVELRQARQKIDPSFHKEAAHTVLELERDVRGIRSLYDAVAARVHEGTEDLQFIEAQMRNVADIQGSTATQLRETSQISSLLHYLSSNVTPLATTTRRASLGIIAVALCFIVYLLLTRL